MDEEHQQENKEGKSLDTKEFNNLKYLKLGTLLMHLTQIRYQVNTIFSKNSCLCPIQTCMKAVQVCFAHLVSLFPLLEGKLEHKSDCLNPIPREEIKTE